MTDLKALRAIAEAELLARLAQYPDDGPDPFADMERDQLWEHCHDLAAAVLLAREERDAAVRKRDEAQNSLARVRADMRPSFATVLSERSQLRTERDHLRNELEGAKAWRQQLRDAVVRETAEAITDWLDLRADFLDGYTEEQSETQCIAAELRTGAWREGSDWRKERGL